MEAYRACFNSILQKIFPKNEKSTQMNQKSTFLAFERLFQIKNRVKIDLRNFDLTKT